MTLFSRAEFEAHVLGLPGVTVNEQWESAVAKVGGKVFALFPLAEGSLVFKVSELSFEGLTSLEDVRQASYFAKGQWVSVGAGAGLSDEELAAYLIEAHRLIAKNLSKKTRTEIGLDA